MLTARHDPWAQALFTPYITWLFRRHFHALRLLGEPPRPDPGLPLLIVPNHSTWWDGFFLYILNLRLLGRRLHLMMLEEQLARFRFFRRIGAFGIRPGSPGAVAAALDYSVSVLTDPANALCLFPQGEMRHPATRPLGFRRGLERILKRHGGPVGLLPLAIRCDFYEDQRPEAVFLFDRCHVAGPGAYPRVDWLEERVTALLEEADRVVRAREPGRLLVSGKRQLSESWAGRGRRRPG
jgi:1-acyl-sn-glycerol-3-phosphate acyltransferase